jgi:putative addiction module killer protein
MICGTGYKRCCPYHDRAIEDRAGEFFKYGRRGAGVYETKIDFGPGYRIYFGKDGDQLVILVGEGSKKC